MNNLLTKYLLVSVLCLGWCNAQAALASGFLRTVALSDEVTPDGATSFDFFSTPVINNAGETAFAADLSPTGAGSSFVGVLTEGGGGDLRRLSVDNLLSFSPRAVYLSDSGHTAFSDSDSFASSRVWVAPPGGLAEVVADANRSGSLNDATTPLPNNGLTLFAFSDAGQPVIAGLGAIWTVVNDQVVNVAREGGPLPGFPNATIADIAGIQGHINASGEIAFSAWVNGIGIVPVVAQVGDDGEVSARFVGSRVAGDELIIDTSFIGNFEPTINSQGDVAFTARNRSPELIDGWWQDVRGSGLELVAENFETVPGTDAIIGFPQFTTIATVLLNERGQSALSTGDAIILNTPGEGLSVVAEGLVPPFQRFALNADGQVAFENGLGIYALDTSGDLQAIAEIGGMLDVSDDPNQTDLRTIASLVFAPNFPMGSGNSDGAQSAFNDHGQLVFGASFTDGSSGVFVSSLVAVPEPSAMLLTLGGLAASAIAGRTRRHAS